MGDKERNQTKVGSSPARVPRAILRELKPTSHVLPRPTFCLSAVLDAPRQIFLWL